MSDISVILPVHTIEGDILEYYGNAIESIKKQTVKPTKVLVVIPKDETIKTTLEGVDYGDIKDLVTIVENDGKTDFASQINYGVEQTTTKWFSILEVDDTYSPIWFKNVEEYQNSYEDVDLFLPIVVDINTGGQFVHFSNEPVWAKDFSEELGVIDQGCLENFPNFQIDGAVINVESFKEVGGLKPSLELYFNYEFFLRMSYNDKRMMVVPKLGYKKLNMRPNSLFHNYYNGDTKLDPVEARFWFSTAKKEYFFTKDREIKYMQGVEA